MIEPTPVETAARFFWEETAASQPKKRKKPQLFVAAPNGLRVDMMSIPKHFRDALELHHKPVIRVDDYGNRYWILDVKNPLVHWSLVEGVPIGKFEPIKPSRESTICKRCELYTSCKTPFQEPIGPTDPMVTVIYEFVSGAEDDRGQLGGGGLTRKLRELYASLSAKIKFPFEQIRWMPLVRCANRMVANADGKLEKRVVNYKTKANWCGLFAVQDLMLHPPKLIMPVGSVCLGYLSFKSNAQDWGGQMLTYRGWPDDWLMEVKYSKPVDGETRGHPLFGQKVGQKVPMIPIQSPGIVEATQNPRIVKAWCLSILQALTKVSEGIQPKQYVLPHYLISTDPKVIISTLQELIDAPGTLVAFDTETTGLKAFAEDARIVYIMLRWEDASGPRSIGFPWAFAESPVNVAIPEITPYLVEALCVSKLVGHNLSFDALFSIANIDQCDLDRLADACVYDTWHEAFILRQAKGTLSLDMMAYKHVPELGGYDEDFTILIELYRELLHPESGGHYALCPPEFQETHLKPYVMGDVEVAYRTHGVLQDLLAKSKSYKIPLAHPTKRGRFRWYQTMGRAEVYEKIVSPASRVLIKMMARGLKIDEKELGFQEEMFPQLIFEARKKLREVTPEVLEWCEYNEAQTPGWFLDLESKDHLREILFKKMRLPVKALTASGLKKYAESDKIDNYLGDIDRVAAHIRKLSKDDNDFVAKWEEYIKYIAIDKFTLTALSATHPRVRPLLEYRSIFKQYASYIRPIRNITTVGIDKKARTQAKHLARDGLVHTRFMITGTRSGRLSCVDGRTQLQVNRDGRVEYVAIEDLDVTQHVSIKTHLNRWKKITRKFFKGYEEMFRVRTNKGHTIVCTRRHSFLAETGWVHLSDLKVGDRLRVDAGFSLEVLPMGAERSCDAQAYTGRDKHSGDVACRTKSKNSVADVGTLLFKVWRSDGSTKSEGLIYEVEKQQEWCKNFITHTSKGRDDDASKSGLERRHDFEEAWCELAHNPEKYPSTWAGGPSMGFESTSLTDTSTVSEASGVQREHCGGLVKSWSKSRPIYQGTIQMLCGNGLNSTLGARPGPYLRSVIVEERAEKNAEYVLVHKLSRVDPSIGAGGAQHTTCTSVEIGSENVRGLRPDKHECCGGSGRTIPQEGRGPTERQPNTFDGLNCCEGDVVGRRERHISSCDKDQKCYGEITSIESVGVRGVWDIQVEDDHSYVACGFINHNSAEPNLQQLPSRGQVKRIYVSRFGDKGCLYQGDLSQIELRLIAAACGDESMVNAYVDGIDLHSLTMSKIFKMPYEHCIKDHVSNLQKAGKDKEAKECELKRKISKTVNFLTGYGGGAQGLQATLAQDGIYKTVEECEAFLEAFFDSYPALREYLTFYKGFIADNGVAVSMLGRVRLFEEVTSEDQGLKNKALRAGCNHLIQATASDMMLICICAIETLMREAGLKSVLVSTVHDSLLVDSLREELPMIHEISMGVFKNIPDILDAWLGDQVDLSWTRVVPYDGDCEVGKTYLDMVKLSHEGNDWADVCRRMDKE